ncbi:MAG: nuclear transport factor 2 family protein [Alphaproteobacteria bacterium]|nr:nuclear transport factor 2 family protein [Alphaproteobacteria bacterium]
MVRTLGILALALGLVACAPKTPAPPTPAEIAAIGEAAHKAYVDAINSNDAAKVAAVLTDDIVYQAPHEPEIVGKAAVRAWVERYFGAYSTVWKKTALDFIVAGDWAFERYAYESTDTPKAGGVALTDKGKGLNIYHKDADGVWRVARDSWSSDLPVK